MQPSKHTSETNLGVRKVRLNILPSLAIVSLLIVAMAAGSFSFFSAEVRSDNNTFTAGTLYLGRDETSPGILDTLTPIEEISKLLPGDSLTCRVEVTNLGSADAYVNGISAGISETPGKFLANALRVRTALKGTVLFEGSLLALDGEQPVPTTGEILLAPGETAELEVNIELVGATGNWYKGKKLGNVSLALWATQLSRSERQPDTKVRIAAGNLQAFLNAAHPGDLILIPPGDYPRLKLMVPGITVKALDVVYETAVAGFDITAPGVTVQGFYVLNPDPGKAGIVVHPGAAPNCRILDNIVVWDDNFAILLLPGPGTGGQPALVTRNDVRRSPGSEPPALPGINTPIQALAPAEVHDNLGDDLDPAAEAL